MIELYHREGKTWFKVPLSIHGTVVRPSVLREQLEGVTMKAVVFQPPPDGSYHEYFLIGTWFPPTPCKWLVDGQFHDVDPSDIFELGIAPSSMVNEYRVLVNSYELAKAELARANAAFASMEQSFLKAADAYRAVMYTTPGRG